MTTTRVVDTGAKTHHYKNTAYACRHGTRARTSGKTQTDRAEHVFAHKNKTYVWMWAVFVLFLLRVRSHTFSASICTRGSLEMTNYCP